MKEDRNIFISIYAGVVKLADTRDLKSRVGNSVRVRIPSPAPRPPMRIAVLSTFMLYLSLRAAAR